MRWNIESSLRSRLRAVPPGAPGSCARARTAATATCCETTVMQRDVETGSNPGHEAS